MTTTIGKLRFGIGPDTILGRGNDSIVFSGFCKETYLLVFESDEPVAVKRVPKIDISQREVDIMKKTTGNPNILRLIHIEKDNDYL